MDHRHTCRQNTPTLKIKANESLKNNKKNWVEPSPLMLVLPVTHLLKETEVPLFVFNSWQLRSTCFKVTRVTHCCLVTSVAIVTNGLFCSAGDQSLGPTHTSHVIKRPRYLSSLSSHCCSLCFKLCSAYLSVFIVEAPVYNVSQEPHCNQEKAEQPDREREGSKRPCKIPI